MTFNELFDLANERQRKLYGAAEAQQREAGALEKYLKRKLSGIRVVK
jgi:hypothetical protein